MYTRTDDFADVTEESIATTADLHADEASALGLNHPLVARRLEAFGYLQQVEPQVRLVLAASRSMEYNV